MQTDMEIGVPEFAFPLKSSENRNKSNRCLKLEHLLETYAGVLPQKLLQKLPPNRKQTIHIELEPGTVPQGKGSYRMYFKELEEQRIG